MNRNEPAADLYGRLAGWNERPIYPYGRLAERNERPKYPYRRPAGRNESTLDRNEWLAEWNE